MKAEIALTARGRIWTMDAADLTERKPRSFIEASVNRGPEVIPGETAILEEWRSSDGG